MAGLRGAEEHPRGPTLRRRIIAGAVVIGLGMRRLAAGLFGGGGIGLVGLGALDLLRRRRHAVPAGRPAAGRLIGAPAARFGGIPGRSAG